MDLPLFQGAHHEAGGVVTATSSGTTITTPASAHTKGSWSPIDTSTPVGIHSFWLNIHVPSSYRYMVDLAIGPSGFEEVILPNYGWYTRTYVGGQTILIPMALPAGVRLSARAQSGSSSAQTVPISVTYNRGPFIYPPQLGKATTYGAVPASTEGTQFDPGGTAHTKPASYTELVASTSDMIRALLLCFTGSTGQSGTPDRPTTSWLFDIAIGAASSEVIVLPDIPLTCNYLNDCVDQSTKGPYDVLIPAGTRLSARCQCSLTDAEDRLTGLFLIGFS